MSSLDANDPMVVLCRQNRQLTVKLAESIRAHEIVSGQLEEARARAAAAETRERAVAEVAAQLGRRVAELIADGERLRRGLAFYAQGWHFALSDPLQWDSVSGEPPNFHCDAAGSATIEDGAIAKQVLDGGDVEFELNELADEEPSEAEDAERCAELVAQA
jgi:hypothetical protein